MSEEIIETAKATQEVAKAATKGLEVSEKVGGFFAKVLGEPIETATGILGDKLKFMRWERQVRLIDRVQEINKQRGIEGREIPVPPKLALPIIESASLEDNDTLQDLWAKLISSAQGPTSADYVRTAFIDIIKQLEVIDVMILNAMFDGFVENVGRSNIHHGSSRRVSFSKQSIMQAFNIPEHVYEDTVDNLMRVRCVCSEVKVMSGMSISGESATIDKGYDSLCLTSLGIRFVIACVK
ncbi:Abi-alpha family protein [Aeromonas veronii]|uniref:Abi-alpha family protein n=1 Tax=Aeromonas veronii TaxID=654 RepID=UPI003D1A2E1F